MKAMNVVKIMLSCLLLAGSFSVINAQDIITQKNGDEIQVKVMEVGTQDVKYKKYGNDSGPTYTLSKSEIFMIKYENGEKDMFENDSENPSDVTPSNISRAAVPGQSSNQNRRQTQPQTQVETPANKETLPPPTRKAYVGIGIGGAIMTESYDNVDGGIQVNINFGYLFSKNIGIAASFLSTSFDLSNYSDTSIGLTGLMAGPLFSTATDTQMFEFDLRPMIGFASGSVTIGKTSGTTDETAFAFGVGGSARWNCSSRISISGNVDYYHAKINGVDLSSVGITAGVNFRF